MGLFKRLHRVTIGRIEAFLTRVEDPEIVFPQLVKEMEGQLREATDAEAKAAAAVKGAERAVHKNGEKLATLSRGAALAIQEGDEATARQAVTAQIDAEQNAERLAANLEQGAATRARATAARKQITDQLEELRNKKSEILTRSRVAKAQQKIQQTVSGSVGSSDSILDAVARLEAGIEETEAELEIQAKLAGEGQISATLEQRIEELDTNAEVEKRLAALREQAAGGGQEPSGQ